MKIDEKNSAYREVDSASQDFTVLELRRLRALLRRLQFLEEMMSRRADSVADPFVEREASALEWVLIEMGFLAEPRNVESHE